MHDNKSFLVPKAGFKIKKEVGQYPWYAENLDRGFSPTEHPLLDLQVEKSISFLHQRIKITII